MVKPDISRDYYQDLELKPGADLSEIKKQFKKLAMKYHPDRNPGHEAEFIPKFQAINVAHEVLSDSTLKIKYDTDRQKAGYRGYAPMPPRAGMPPRNPYASTYYPPPPPPPPPPPQPRPSYNTTTSSTAKRFSKYADAFQKGKQAGGAQETASSRTDRAEAWGKMRPGGPFGGQGYRTPPKPAPAGGTSSGYTTPNRASTPNQASHDARNNYFEYRPSFSHGRDGMDPLFNRRHDDMSGGGTKTRRKGYAPDASGGDEPPAPDTSAYHVHRSNARTQASRPQNVPDAPPRPSPTSRKQDPLGNFKPSMEDAFGEHERVSTPYTTGGGERTHLGATLGRSTSTREGIQRASSHLHTMENPERPPTSHRRHRSVSASRRRRQSVSDESDKVANSPLDSPAKPDFISINKASRSMRERPGTIKTPADIHNKAEQGRSRYAPRVESDSSGNEQDHRQHRNSGARARGAAPGGASGGRRKPRTTAEPVEPLHDKEQNRQVSNPNPNPNPLDTFTHRMASALDDQSAQEQRPASASGVKERTPLKYFYSFHNRSGASRSFENLSMGPDSYIPDILSRPNFSQHDRENSNANRKKNNSFSFQTRDDMFTHAPPTASAGFRSKSTENINTRFLPGDWNGKFESNVFSGPPPPPMKRDHRQRSPRRTQVPRGRSPNRPPRAPMPPTQPGVFMGAATPTTNSLKDPPPALRPTRFFPEDWDGTIKQNDFHQPPPLNSKRSNPRVKSSRSTGAPSRVSKATSLGATVGSDEETSAYDRSGSKSAESSSSRSSGFGSAMDIDPPAPAQEKERSHGIPPRPTYVPNLEEERVPPTNAGVRQGHMDTQRSGRRPSVTMPPPPPKQVGQQPIVPPAPSRHTPPRAATSLGHSTRTAQPQVDLTDLKNVEPFTFPSNGLSGMDSISSNVPFESRSSST
ncbi:hypothetical protein FGG08_006941, partial [Glutinoglossum americanum]